MEKLGEARGGKEGLEIKKGSQRPWGKSEGRRSKGGEWRGRGEFIEKVKGLSTTALSHLLWAGLYKPDHGKPKN